MATALATPVARAHTFPPVHSVVVQVEPCALALLIGYTAGTGESTERIVARVASQPPARAADALRDTLTAFAMASLRVEIDGAPVKPTSVSAKIGLDPGGTRPAIVVLATFALRGGSQALVIAPRDPRTTRISWHDQASTRMQRPPARDRAPAQDHWFSGVASFLLPLGPATGGSSCARSGSTVSGSPSSGLSPSSAAGSLAR
jgi:hypothetical protein